MLQHTALKHTLLPASVLLLAAAGLLLALLPLCAYGQGKNKSANVRNFGAVGDGKTDDTAALQRAVDEGSGQVRIPSGVYKLTKPIVVDLRRVGLTSISGRGTVRLLMAGPGPAIRIIGGHNGTAAPATVKDEVWLKERMPLLDGLEIMGAHPEACGIESRGALQLTISRVTVRRALHGIHLVVRNRNVIISECHIYDNRGVGVFFDHVNLHQFNSANIRILGSAKNGRKGVAGPAHFGNITIANNVLSDVQVNIDLNGARGVAITGNTLWKGFSHQLQIRNCSNLTIAANVLDRNPQYQQVKDSKNAVLIADSSDVVFSGNQINGEHGAKAGVIIERCRRFNIFGNNILDCDGPELLLRDVKHSRLAGCILRDDREGHKNSPTLAILGGEGNIIQGNHLSHPAVHTEAKRPAE